MEHSKQLSSEQPLRIDIVSDVVCPWCVIGYRQLAEALKQTNTEHEIHWHPFELNPNMPSEGQNCVNILWRNMVRASKNLMLAVLD